MGKANYKNKNNFDDVKKKIGAFWRKIWYNLPMNKSLLSINYKITIHYR